MKTLFRLLLVCSFPAAVAAQVQPPRLPVPVAAQAVDTVTGVGWITGTPSGARGSFGFVARDPAAPSGSMSYVDHELNLRVKSTAITSYTIIDANTRQFQGVARTPGGVVTFVVVVTDAGEPGSSDTFSIALSSGYSAGGTLGGGNAQIHPELQ